MNSKMLHAWKVTKRLSLVLFSASLIACGGGGSDAPSKIRFVHAAQTERPFDIHIDGELREASLQKSSASRYQFVESGERLISVYSELTDILFNEDTLLVEDDKRYSVLFRGSTDGTTEVTERFVFEDANVPIESGQYAIRFIVSTPSMRSLNVFIIDADAESIEDIVETPVQEGTLGSSAYFVFPEGRYQIVARDSDTGERVFETEELFFPEGLKQSFFLFENDVNNAAFTGRLLIDEID